MWSVWFVASALLIASQIEAVEYATWSTNYARVLYNQELVPRLITDQRKSWMVTQCAEQCLRKADCKLFVYEKSLRLCKLSNTAIEALGAADKRAKENSTIYPKSSFQIETNSLDACSNVKCKNGGICALRHKTTNGFVCYCKSGFTGKYCENVANKPEWSAWSAWSPCSSSCDTGYQYSSRTCIFKNNGSVVDRSLCDGQDARIQSCFLLECPKWTKWSKWNLCSTHFTCGDGLMTRSRTCSNGQPNIDSGCIGMSEEEKPCSSPSCSINSVPVRLVKSDVVGEGIVEIYDNIRKTWGQVCDDNFNTIAGQIVCKSLRFQGLHEVVKTPKFPAPKTPFLLKNLRCNSASSTLQSCRHDGWNTSISCTRGAAVSCIVDGGWSPWTQWSTCSVPCGTGLNVRERFCTHPKPSYGKSCSGSTTEKRPCEKAPCPVDGYWLPWTKWSSCNVTCGGGVSTRQRKCVPPKHGGKACAGIAFESKQCNNFLCPVDGVWTEFTPWTKCNVSCGGGLQSRTRECIGPFHKGKDCVGDKKEIRACNTVPCPIDGYWNIWGSWSACNVSCGGGNRYRTRKCVEPKFGGKQCVGVSKTVQACNDHHCPVDGKWNAWSNWTACSKTCGNGTRTRERTCNGPFYGGKLCEGPTVDTKLCNTFECPVDGIWRPWSKWTPCTKSCGGGTTMRTRVCVGPFHGGRPCAGDDKEEKACNTKHCPVHGKWKEWTPWSACSTTCSQGSESRKRTCIPPQHGGRDCEGSSMQEQSCNLGPCPLPGKWSAWSEWTKCSVSCRQGSRTRSRVCEKVNKAAPLKGCNGTEQETDICNDFTCEPILQSCSAWKRVGMIGNFIVDIDPTSKKIPIRVKCNLNGSVEGETIVHHNLEKETQVPKFENPGMNVLTPTYGGSMQSIISLVDKSKSCRQFIQIKCKGSSIHTMRNSKTTDMMSWWTNRYDEKMTYWGGSSPQQGNCGCSVTNTCVWKNLTCNCDANDNVWRADEGYLTHKADLPVRSLRIGDTGGPEEDAIVKLGPLICKG